MIYFLTNMHYATSGTQGPYSYNVNFGDGIQAKDLGVLVNINLSFGKTWFVDEEKNVTLEISAERVSNIVQNFSWRIFWVDLYTLRDGRWHGVGVGSHFLELETGRREWSNSHLYKRQNVTVGIANLNYLESVDKAWFRIGIMMDIYHNNTQYSLTFYSPMGEIGPVAILSPLYSPIGLAISSAIATAVSTALMHQLVSRTAWAFKQRLF